MWNKLFKFILSSVLEGLFIFIWWLFYSFIFSMLITKVEINVDTQVILNSIALVSAIFTSLISKIISNQNRNE